jgi:hypothetical protein
LPLAVAAALIIYFAVLFHFTVIPGATNDREVIQKAVAGCDGVLTVLVPWGSHHYSSGTAQAVLDHAQPGARLIFSCGWHITLDGEDVYPPSLQREEKIARLLGAQTTCDEQQQHKGYNKDS